MSTITTRAGKGSPLTNNEVDANFTNLNTDKAELSGSAFTGAITTNSTIDGRDVATDGTKLDGIEAGATADQTAAEIKTAYESNADTNAFTDADESKLDGIEAGADVTNTATVTAAGALMDSELTAIASVKALNQGVATTDSPTFAGLTTSADISFGDSDKAIFGAGSDLQIYHNANNSFIQDAGTGSLYIDGSASVNIRETSTNAPMAVFTGSGSVDLYHNGIKKLATTSTGIDVTGNMIADGVGIAGQTNPTYKLDGGFADQTWGWYLNSSYNAGFTYNTTERSLLLATRSAENIDHIKFATGGAATERMRIDASGNLLVGASSASAKLTVGTFGDTARAAQFHGGSILIDGGAATDLIMGDGNVAYMSLQTTDNATAMKIRNHSGSADLVTVERASGNVGIGEPSPNRKFHVNSGSTNVVAKFESTDAIAAIEFVDSGGSAEIGNSGNALVFFPAGSERMRIDSSGNVGIGTSLPSAVCDIVGSPVATGDARYELIVDENQALATGRGGGLAFARQGVIYGGIKNITSGASDNNTDMYFQTRLAGTVANKMVIKSSGNVGIGTSSPWETLSIPFNEKLSFGSSAYPFSISRSSAGQLVTTFEDGYNASDARIDFKMRGGAVTPLSIVGSGNVGIGNSSPVELLTIGSTSDTNVRALFLSSTTGAGTIQFGDGTGASAYSGYINYTHSDNALAFATGSTERARIDSSGNLLVGTTDTAPGAGDTNAGVSIRGGSDNRSFFSVNGDYVMHLNRNTSDGNILEFAKDGTNVGSIGSTVGKLKVSSVNTGLIFADAFDEIYPLTNGVTTLGDPGARFKDLYLSGGISTNTATGLSITANSTNRGILNLSTSTAYQLIGGSYYGYTGYKTGGYHRWFGSDGGEDMRIDSSGNLLVGTSNSSQSIGDGTKIKEWGSVQVVNDSSTGGGDAFSYYSSSGGQYRFWVSLSGQIASIYTSIQSLSDQRFKENIRDLDDGLSKVMQLQPRKFDWKEGTGKNITNDRGFIAQEFEQVFPDLVNEWKDEAPEGEEPYKAVSADLIPTLVKAIQEQQTLIESLTARIAALEE